MTIVILGIDLGKNSCSVVGLGESGAVVVRRRMRRQTILGFAAKLPSCIVAMEACCGAHYLGRLLTNQGCEPNGRTLIGGSRLLMQSSLRRSAKSFVRNSTPGWERT
jgi:hypothetical protein